MVIPPEPNFSAPGDFRDAGRAAGRRWRREDGGPWLDALVTDAQLRAVVAGIRGLGRDGRRVLALAPGKSAAGLFSRFAVAGATGPSPTTDEHGFVLTVRSLIAEYGARAQAQISDGPVARPDALVVYPGREKSIDALSSAWSTMPSGAVLACADPSTLDRLRNKATLSSLAEEAGVRIPRQLARGSAGELASARLSVPCVVKPTTSGASLSTARLVNSIEELEGILRSLPSDTPLLVQERARGPLASLAVVISQDGRLVARFQQLAMRTWPAETGVSARAVSIPPDEELTARAVRLLVSAGFWGMAQLQFIGADREARLIDFNPRFFGSLPLALASGVNLPAAWHAVTLGRSLPPPGPYRVGVAYRWLEGDLAAARRGKRTALRPAASPRTGALWAKDDPLPGVIFGAGAIKSRIQRRLLRTDG